MDELLESIRTSIASSVRSLVAGDPRPIDRIEYADDCLFDPDSAIWEVHRDAAMLVGGIRALLLQTLHPPTMAGVAQHSNYRDDPLGRLQRTAQYLGTTTYGSREQATRAVDAIKVIHERVRGTTSAGQPYRANDPHLLAWVHATEVDSFLRAYQRYATRPLPPARADQYVAEMAVVADMLGAETPPRSVAELRETMRSYRSELGATRECRNALRFLALPPLPLQVRGAYGLLFGAAVDLLPRWARRMLWLPRIPVASDIAVRGATFTLLRILGWALAPAEDSQR